MWSTLREISGTNTPRVPIYFVPTSVSAQSHGAAKKWVRNRTLRIQAQAGTNDPAYIKARAVIAYRDYGTADSRYDGPNSSYGQAVASRAEAHAKLRTVSAPSGAIPRHEHPGSLPGDLYLTRQPGSYYRRYGWDGKLRGLTMRRAVEIALKSTWPVALDPDGRYWEHGASVVEILAEEQRKREIALQKRADVRADRAARLLARVSDRVTATREDARAVGACVAGIEAYCSAHALGESVTARELVALAISSRQPLALRAAVHAARRSISV